MIIPACQAVNCLLLMWAGFTADLQSARSGYLSAYAEAPTVGTLAYRQEIGDVPQDLSSYDVFIAVSDCGLIGHEGTLYTNAGPLRAIVMDCAGNDGTPSWMAQNNIVAEIDFWTWQRHPELPGTWAAFVVKVGTVQ